MILAAVLPTVFGMRPGPGELLHFSDEPDIGVFHPHVAATARETAAYVWAVDGDHSPSYWFPRDCPRAMAWVGPDTIQADALRILGPGVTRVHVIEYSWLAQMQSATLFVYRMPKAQFRTLSPTQTHAWVSTEPVTPLGPAQQVSDLLELHRAADIQLRLVDRIWPWWDAVTASSVGFSGIRLHNAAGYPSGR